MNLGSWLGATLAAVATVGAGTPALASGPFDGIWSVTLTCPTAPDGATGYSFYFAARVKDGVLHGERGTRGQSGWLALDGQLQPDGTAILFAKGLTGPTNYNVGRVPPLTQYEYHVNAHFDAVQGTGTRTEIRPCAFYFRKA